MLKILVKKWDRNKNKLESFLRETSGLNNCCYKDLVKATFEHIFNDDTFMRFDRGKLEIESITEIDDGDYQGTLLFLIPFATYQPSESEYLMTYVGYGSCSGCDTLQAIQTDYHTDDKLTDSQVKDFMTLCKDILSNTIKPYNSGWREEEEFNHAEAN